MVHCPFHRVNLLHKSQNLEEKEKKKKKKTVIAICIVKCKILQEKSKICSTLIITNETNPYLDFLLLAVYEKIRKFLNVS